MNVGVVFPQIEMPADPNAIRTYAEAVEEMGYQHLLVYDHVLGADPSARPGWTGPYSVSDPFHEPFVLFGYLAAVTRTLELITGILILGQRQTALVAKQAAQVDVLSRGRLRLGIGIGWNDVEYEALGMDFHNRGRRSEEQVAVLRALWTKESVSFEGRWHRITAVGINPLPVQRPIPIWFGGGRAEPVLRRIARMGDGWMPQYRPDEEGRRAVERYRALVTEAGRDPNAVTLSARVNMNNGVEDAVRHAMAWQELGADYVSVNTMRSGFTTVDAHIEALRNFRQALGAWQGRQV